MGHHKFAKLAGSFVASYAAAGLGSLATIKNIPTWYAGLDKPFFTPPNWLFGPVWTVLYGLIAVSLYLVWVSPPSDRRREALTWYAIQLMLNAAWSIVFFGLHQLWPGVVVVLALLASIVTNIITAHHVNPLAARLLIPYALWVSFASCLTVGLAIMN